MSNSQSHWSRYDLWDERHLSLDRFAVEDPENGFTPDFGKILTYRSAGGFGVRLDGALGVNGAVITPYYDSMLVKVTAYARTFGQSLDRMNRALSEFRVRGVKTNIPFLENVLQHPAFQAGECTTSFIEENPALFQFSQPADRATALVILGVVVAYVNQCYGDMGAQSWGGAFLAAANRAQFAIKSYPQAPALEEAVFVLVLAYDRLGMNDLRDDADRVMRNNFTASRYLKPGGDRKDVPWWRLWDPNW